MNDDKLKEYGSAVKKTEWDRPFFVRQVSTIVIYFGALFLLVIGLGIYIAVTNKPDSINSTLVNLYFYLVIALIFIVLLGKYYFSCLKMFKTKALTYILYGVAGWIAIYAANILIQNIEIALHVPQETSTNQDDIIASLQANPLLTALFVVILAPLVEETVFRVGIMSGILRIPMPKIVGAILAIFISGFVFGGMHFIPAYMANHDYKELIAGIPYIADGMILGFIFYKTRNIFASAITHFLQNTFAVVIILLMSMLGLLGDVSGSTTTATTGGKALMTFLRMIFPF